MTALGDRQLADLLDKLRAADSVRPMTKTAIRRELGRPAIALVRREYFPRWRPERVLDANARLRAFRSIVVQDDFERRLVEAVAPGDIALQVTVRSDVAGSDRTDHGAAVPVG